MIDLLVQGVQCVLAMVSAGHLSMLTHQEEAIRLLSCRKQIRSRYSISRLDLVTQILQ